MDRHPNILDRRRTALLIVDMQEKFAPVIQEYDRIEAQVITLVKAFRIFDLPIFCTEQYPKGLGRTTESLRRELDGIEVIEKMHFTAVGETVLRALKRHAVTHIVVVGIETHVCILQSSLDFAHLGYRVHVVRDATGSRRASDRDAALERLQQHGVTVSCVESVLFELVVVAGTDEFRQISKLIKQGQVKVGSSLHLDGE
ncbi:isochorismatase family protein [candidate division KSB1 bacterium]|nr:isochorismatase family protein [candidate division KSB1 bacterium]RQW05711.1 MAG: isochorismatase family protein [candidate division KSB1 bacterium]